MAIAKLSDEERAALTSTLPGWKMVEGRDAIQRSFRFADFRAAFGFMTQVAVVAEQQDHHPEWFNGWNRVDITLATHDVGGLSTRDVELARAIDAIAATAGNGAAS